MNLEDHDQQNVGNNATADGAGAGVNPGARETQAARTALRRRLVLGGMVGIPAALTVMKPVRTLAKAKKVSCSYSGWHSFKLDSRTSAHPKNKCKSGYNKKFWYNEARKKLPKTKTKGGSTQYNKIYKNNGGGGVTLVTIYQNTTFKSLFGSGTTANIMSLLQSNSSPYSAFLTALFNAYWLNSYGYPYTCADIYKLWAQTSNQVNIALFLQQLDSFS